MGSGGSEPFRKAVAMKKHGIVVTALCAFVLSAGCGHILYADGPYHGKLIDRETKQPIEGAAVVAVWWKEDPAPHPIITFYDAQETLTDQEGNFTVPGIIGGSINPLTKIREPLFTIFKPGHEGYDARKLAPPGETGRTIVQLRKALTREERSRSLSQAHIRVCTPELPEKLRDVGPYCVPPEKVPNLLKLKKIKD